MDDKQLSRSALQFWGMVARNISHELNNVTAILIELAVLMQDRLSAAAPERPPDVQKLAGTLERIGRQLERAKQLGGMLNRFGHSVDSFEEVFSAEEAAREALALCRRPAELRRCTLQLDSSGAPDFSFRGSRFFLLHLLYRAVQLALEAAPAGAELLLTLHKEADACGVVLSADNLSASRDQTVLQTLCEACGGRLSVPEAGRISMLLPESLPPVP